MEKDFYITTPIYYVNDKPHIGHAYTTIVADTLARLHAARGERVSFLAGTDENSQKTVDAAKKSGEDTRAYTDRLAELWRSTWGKLNISNTDFIRTTEDRHIRTVVEIWKRLEAANAIYEGKYRGLYCVGHEAFMKESELVGGLCPDHKTKPELISEKNYFFRLKDHQEWLLKFYEENPNFVAPANRFAEVKKFVEQGLEDVSFSREKTDWGIPVPGHPGHVIYVWADALVNYISAVGIENWEKHPADIHAVGKDILRFHAIIWPAMLHAAKLPPPRQIIANGFFTVDGTKISKSLGNAIDPLELASRYGTDALRYFLLREIPYGEDGDFSEAKLKERYNADLANGLGNFAARVLTLAERDTNIRMYANDANNTNLEKNVSEKIKQTQTAVRKKIEEFKFNEALAGIWDVIAYGDEYVNSNEPWKIADANKKAEVLFNLVVLLDNIAALIAPFLPETSVKISGCITWEGGVLKVKKTEALFPRLG